MPNKSLNRKKLAGLKNAVFFLSLMPLINLAAGALLDGLGANPIERITRSTGYWTLAFLMITLAITPLRRLLGWNWPMRMRRMIALFAFFYGTLHFLTYLVLDQFFDFSAILADIVKRPYITVGFPSYVLMIPLALTSTDRMIRRLGGKRWRLLHRLVYLIAVGGVVHYWWLVKKDVSDPLMFAVILGLLFGARLFSRVIRYARPAMS
jgi:sulfoxide reductase heme-binding subunit YedZ